MKARDTRQAANKCNPRYNEVERCLCDKVAAAALEAFVGFVGREPIRTSIQARSFVHEFFWSSATQTAAVSISASRAGGLAGLAHGRVVAVPPFSTGVQAGVVVHIEVRELRSAVANLACERPRTSAGGALGIAPLTHHFVCPLVVVAVCDAIGPVEVQAFGTRYAPSPSIP